MNAPEQVSSAVVLRSLVLSRLGVPHGFTTRRGGVSGGMFASLNFGNPGELRPEERDPTANIGENIRRALEAIGGAGRRVEQVHQVHGAEVRVIQRDDERAGGPDVKADAIVTDDPGRAVLIRVADCTPVLLATRDGRCVGAVHAGWRGVIGGVAREAVRAMQASNPWGEVVGAIGPCIGFEAFEVGPEVLEKFAEAFPDGRGLVWRDDPGSAEGKGRVDLQAALAEQLAGAGVKEIEMLPQCTVRDGGEFFSHRREGGRTGRMAAIIGPRAEGPGTKGHRAEP